jgi:hypothetical protein
MFDGVIMPGPKGEPLFAKRFQSFLGEMLSI